MYKYKNYEYTLEEIQEAADKKNLSVEEYIKEYNIDPPATETEVTEEVITDPTKEGKKTPSQETVDAAVEVSDTASNSEDFLSVFQRTSARKKNEAKRFSKNY